MHQNHLRESCFLSIFLSIFQLIRLRSAEDNTGPLIKWKGPNPQCQQCKWTLGLLALLQRHMNTHTIIHLDIFSPDHSDNWPAISLWIHTLVVLNSQSTIWRIFMDAKKKKQKNRTYSKKNWTTAKKCADVVDRTSGWIYLNVQLWRKNTLLDQIMLWVWCVTVQAEKGCCVTAKVAHC